MSLTTAPLKVKITREDGTSELRRLGFSFDNSMVSRGRFGGQVQAEGYHLALCKFLLRSLHDLYPELPVAQFSEVVVFAVKDEDGDMVRFDSEEEFVAALPDYESWKTCLRVEATVLKPVLTPSPRNPTTTSTPTPVDDPAPPSAATITAALGSIGALPPVSAASFASGGDGGGGEPAPSESGSTISFVSNMSSSVVSGSGVSSSAPLSGAAFAEAVAAAAAEAAEAPNREDYSAPPSVSGTGPEDTPGASPAGPSGSAANSATGAEGNPSASPAGGDGTSSGTGPDAATPAKAFLTQVLPGLADVLARSIYAAQWAPEMMPNPAATQAQAQGASPGTSQGLGHEREERSRSGRGDATPLSSAMEGLAAVAAAAAGASGAFCASPIRTAPEATPPFSDPAAATSASAAAAAATAASEAATAAGAAATKAATDAAAAAAGAAATAAATKAAAAAAAEAAAFPSPVNARPTGGDPRGEGAGAAAAESDSPIAMHVGVACDVCDMSPIMGTRYKCAVRGDFDLCEGCERTAGSASPFPYLKIRTPAQAPAAIVCLLKADQPRNVKEANAQQTKKKGVRGDGAGAGGLAVKSYAAGQAWRARRDPQHGGWGEGRRNTARWMRDVARHQHHQQQIGGAPSTGIGCFPAGVEVVRNGAGGPVWRGPRMQRRNVAPGGGKEPEQKPAPAKKMEAESGDGAGTQEGSASAAAAAVVPASSPKSAAEHDVAAAAAGAVEEGAAPEDTAPVADPAAADANATATLLESEAGGDGGQTSDYQDMLAASMRSLASSMTASLPASSGAQDGSKGKGGVTAAGEGGKPQAKPMARFVTDVSIADGSPLPPNTRFMKTWRMRNDGAVTFPLGCRLMPVSGDLMSGPEDGVAVEQRAPGEEFHVSVTMTTPPLSGRYIGYWRLRTADGQNFGHRIWADVLVTGGTADLVIEGSMDGDWDLVNMQRLSKAVEDTATDQQNAADDAATAAAASTPTPTPDVTPDTPIETPVETSESVAAATTTAPADIVEAAPEDDDGLAEAIAAIDAAAVRSASLDAGSEETKSSDDAEVAGGKADGEAAVAATKWHRELCSLAEMGFKDTPRNISLLEKHVTTSGGPGMERVLHELLSWHEVSFQ